MKKIVVLSLAFLASNAVAAADSAAFGIPWTGANKATVMQKMKAAGFVLENTENHPQCGIDLLYGGKLLGEKAKVMVFIDQFNNWVGTDVLFVEPGSIDQLYSNISGPLADNYPGFQMESGDGYIHLWKVNDFGNYTISLKQGFDPSSEKSYIAVMYSDQSARDHEIHTCRYYNNGL